MTTPELTDAVGDAAVRPVFNAITKVLLKRGRVEIDGFGEFALRQRKARRGRNRALAAFSRSPRRWS